MPSWSRECWPTARNRRLRPVHTGRKPRPLHRKVLERRWSHHSLSIGSAAETAKFGALFHVSIGQRLYERCCALTSSVVALPHLQSRQDGGDLQIIDKLQ